MLEDLNTVHELTKKVERLRAGEEDGGPEGTALTAGQWWKRLLDMDEKKRIRTLKAILESAEAGMTCSMEMHKHDLKRFSQQLANLAREDRRWRNARRLALLFISTLRKDQEGSIERGTVADKLEMFLSSGDEPVDNRARRIICGHQWKESGRTFECVEPVGVGGGHLEEHHAYLRQGSLADEDLRKRYLQEENDELRRRLGLAQNPGHG